MINKLRLYQPLLLICRFWQLLAAVVHNPAIELLRDAAGVVVGITCAALDVTGIKAESRFYER